ncbi:uridine kinase family protein [Arcanobacterium buesumense]|uniref:ATP-binding protein n=1 Tax=Arcanobacterium buesumense TaxID=2722751 RepID=A0A6H2EI90_9ACTO|nr:ATP-binding protein [Arcanobacterium buesumense]QJC21285.1 ATP-binding protein [Arcanobacterium buesumense]
MSTPLSNDGLFDLPESAQRVPHAKVILVTGPSGSGKTRFTSRTGLPVVSLDDFYYDGDRPGLPRRHGMVDWDSPATWDREGAVNALVELCTKGETTVPIYDMPSNSRVSERTLSMDGRRHVLAEGIFAAEIVDDLQKEGILADALCIARPRVQTFWFRLMRDLDEARKPLPNLLRRGIAHFFHEPQMYRDLEAKGARKVSYTEAQEVLTQMLAAQRWSL